MACLLAADTICIGREFTRCHSSNDLFACLPSTSFHFIQAIESKRLFKVDYHDLFMPFVERINAQKNRKTYATRVFLFLSGEGKLKPIAIELALPRAPAGAREAIRVVTPPKAGEGKDWFWELAKLHASSVDFTYHELITHWYAFVNSF